MRQLFVNRRGNMLKGDTMYKFIQKLYPINRSLTGEGVRRSLKYIQEEIPINIHEISSGSKVFDWVVPKEWHIKEAFIENEKEERIVDFQKSNLHVMGYSEPVDLMMEKEALESHLYSMPKYPEVIPYITSYYSPNWGFCLPDVQRKALKEGTYKVKIDSTLFEGVLNYADMVIEGETKDEILLSTYVCHPSMVNNELSGPAILIEIVKWLQSRKNKYTYRILFAPETIGSIVYLHEHLEHLKKNMKAGIVLTCLALDTPFSFVATKYGNADIDKVVEQNLKAFGDFKRYSFLERGSDERQYNSANVNLPVVALTRTKFGQYKEYHTSADNLEITSPKILEESYQMVQRILLGIESFEMQDSKKRKEKESALKMTVCCEPQLGKRGLYPNVSTVNTKEIVQDMMNVIAYADGTNTDEEIFQFANVSKIRFEETVEKLKKANIVERIGAQNV